MEITRKQIREAAERATENRYQEKMEDMPAFSSTLEAANGYNDGYQEGAKWMQEQIKQYWISVEDRLPKDGYCVLVSSEDTAQSVGYVYKGMFYSYDSNKKFIDVGKTITHWMELPTKPTT